MKTRECPMIAAWLRRCGHACRLSTLIFLSVGLSDASALDLNLNRIFDIGKDVATAATGIDEKDEIAVGREVAGRLLGAAPLVNDAQAQRYINKVGRWIASQTERNALPWHFGIVETPTVNAFAAPGGYILLTRGLYEMLENEAQLAGVLAHEIGHVVRRHHISVMQKSAALSAGNKLAQRDNRSALVNSLIGNGAEIFARGLDRSAELEADAMGVVLAARAGYNPYALVDVLHKLAARGDSDASLALLYKTHPAPADRLSALGAAITPHIDALPIGQEPPLRSALAASSRAPRRAAASPAATEPQPAPDRAAGVPLPSSSTKGGINVDPAGLLRGLLGR